MNSLYLSGVITAQEPETETKEPPCFVYQQQDNEDTVPCNMAGDLLNSLLGLLGFDVPAPMDSETYSTTISVKPKNIYTDLNISLSRGFISDPVYDNGVVEKKISVSISDFSEKDGAYYIDVAGKIDLVESDNIISASWRGDPVDENLSKITPTPSISVTNDNQIKSTAPAEGVILIKYDSLTINYKVDIDPREGVTTGFYESYLVIDDGGCTGKPSFYKIEVPDCYERTQRIKSLIEGLGDGDGDAELGPPSPPKGGEEYTCDYCLCSLNLKYESHNGICPGSGQEDSDRCKSGQQHKDC